MKTYYICDSENFDRIFGNQYPVCITKTEIMRLATEWEIELCDLMEQFHEASKNEIEEYGVDDDNVNYYITDKNGKYYYGFSTYQEAKAFAMEMVAADEENAEYIDNPGQYRIVSESGMTCEVLP